MRLKKGKDGFQIVTDSDSILRVRILQLLSHTCTAVPSKNFLSHISRIFEKDEVKIVHFEGLVEE